MSRLGVYFGLALRFLTPSQAHCYIHYRYQADCLNFSGTFNQRVNAIVGFPKMGCSLRPQENVLMNVKDILYVLKDKFIKYIDLYNESYKIC